MREGLISQGATSIGETTRPVTPTGTYQRKIDPLKIEFGENGVPPISALSYVASNCRSSWSQSHGLFAADERICEMIRLCEFSFLSSVCGWYDEVRTRLPFSERRSSMATPEIKFEPRLESNRAGAPYSMKSPPGSATTVAVVWFGVAYDQRLSENFACSENCRPRRLCTYSPSASAARKVRRCRWRRTSRPRQRPVRAACRSESVAPPSAAGKCRRRGRSA